MSTINAPRRADPSEVANVRRRARWSLGMPAIFVVVYVVTSFIGTFLVFPVLGLHEGDIFLFAHSVGGWVAAVVGWLLLAAAPVTGLVLGIRARRDGAGTTALVGIALNAVVALLVAYTAFDEVRMAYFPGMTFPFPS